MTEKEFGPDVTVRYHDGLFQVCTEQQSVWFTTEEARELIRFIQATVLEEAARSWEWVGKRSQ